VELLRTQKGFPLDFTSDGTICRQRLKVVKIEQRLAPMTICITNGSEAHVVLGSSYDDSLLADSNAGIRFIDEQTCVELTETILGLK
jgi:hypothetical protein